VSNQHNHPLQNWFSKGFLAKTDTPVWTKVRNSQWQLQNLAAKKQQQQTINKKDDTWAL